MLQEKGFHVGGGSIDLLIEQFRLHAEAICGEAADPALCADMAMHWNGSFADWLGRQGIDADILVCEDPKSALAESERGDWHVVVQIGSITIDWAGRGLDRTCAVPRVEGVLETMRRWGRLTEFCLYEAIRERDRVEAMAELRAA